ncbi:MAG: hypothetical protein R6U27_14935 [Desulfobacterales bacterium]
MFYRSILLIKHILYGGLTILFILHTANGYADENNDYIQQVATGSINWTKGLVRSKGISNETRKYQEDGNFETLTINNAIEQARNNLLKTVYKVKIDAFTQLEKIIDYNKDIQEKIFSMVDSIPVVNQNFIADGTAEAIIEMPMFNGFSQLVLPHEITQIAAIKPILNEKPHSVDKTENNSSQQSMTAEYTGLVVNAAGLNAVPAMAPKILDERGEQVYGAAYASRNFAVQIGMCLYVKDFHEALKNERVGENPLVVHGIRTHDTGFSDIVISNAEASKIRSSSKNITFLKQCRVVIVLD